MDTIPVPIIIYIIALALLPIFIVVVVIATLNKRARETQAILATGEPAQARVAQVDLTGKSVNDQPEVRMLLAVHPVGRAPYWAWHTTFVSLLAIPRIQPGCMLDVRIDRSNPTRVALVGM